MSLICPFCLSGSTALPRCPACHASLPNTQETADWCPPGWAPGARLRADAAGSWLVCERGGEKGLAWVSDPGSAKEPSPVAEKAWGVRPLEQGLHDGRAFCVWPWPETTLPASSPKDAKTALGLWSACREAGAFAHYHEWFPWELVRWQGTWRFLQGRPSPPGLPAAGTLHAPERLLSQAPGERSVVFEAAAWFLFMVSGAYPVGLPTPVSWRRTNLEPIDVAVFEALRAEPSARPTLEELARGLEEAVQGRSVVSWVVDGLLYAAGAAFLVAWAGGALWVVTKFDLL